MQGVSQLAIAWTCDAVQNGLTLQLRGGVAFQHAHHAGLTPQIELSAVAGVEATA